MKEAARIGSDVGGHGAPSQGWVYVPELINLQPSGRRPLLHLSFARSFARSVLVPAISPLSLCLCSRASERARERESAIQPLYTLNSRSRNSITHFLSPPRLRARVLTSRASFHPRNAQFNCFQHFGPLPTTFT